MEEWDGLSIKLEHRLSRILGRDIFHGMARTKRKRVSPTKTIPAPPTGEGKEDLHVEIDMSVGWRIQVGLFQLKASGKKTTKRELVQRFVVEGLDRLDEELAKDSRNAA